eukprot:Gb_31556 [translate_table: standard]
MLVKNPIKFLDSQSTNFYESTDMEVDTIAALQPACLGVDYSFSERDENTKVGYRNMLVMVDDGFLQLHCHSNGFFTPAFGCLRLMGRISPQAKDRLGKMNPSNFDPETPHSSTLYSPEALWVSGRRSDAMDGDRYVNVSPAQNDRKSSPSCFSGHLQIGSSKRKSGTWNGEENEQFQGSSPYYEEIHSSRTSSFGNQRLSFSIGGPVQVPQGNLGLTYDVESARTSACKDPKGYFDLHGHGNGNLEGVKQMAPPIFLKFVDLKYKVAMSKPSMWRKPVSTERPPLVEKEILHGISGSVNPGEFLAMMGPSGSGKTTLLSLLGGRNHQCMTGKVTYNDLPFNKSLKRRMGFVTQDDIAYPHLTVRETLVYAALLTLPRELSKQEKIDRADRVINDLRLERCIHTNIGSPFVRGVSGGERKRVCIGHELLMDPSLILLDEPTSGLDSTTALRITQLLKNIALQGRTVVTTIHQPSSRVFHSFDKLILLSEGRLLYFGKATGALDHFSSLGFKPHITMNPADFLLDLCSGDVDDIPMPLALQQDTVKIKDIRKYLVDSYESMRPATVEGSNPLKLGTLEKFEEKREWGATWLQQFSILMVRGLKDRRHEYLSWIRFIQVLSIAAVAGCLWWQSKIYTEKQLEDQVGLLFFIAMFWGYFPLFTAIFTFPQERAILAKERGSDMYCLSSYFLARTLGDLPLDLILACIFIVVVYLMAHLRMSVTIFFLTMLTNFLNAVTSQGLGLAIGAAMMDVKKATTFASVLVLAFMITGGYFVQHVPAFFKWIRYCSFQYYTFKLLIKLQYSDNQLYDCTKSSGCKSLGSSQAFHGVSLGGGGEEAWAMLIMFISGKDRHEMYIEIESVLNRTAPLRLCKYYRAVDCILVTVTIAIAILRHSCRTLRLMTVYTLLLCRASRQSGQCPGTRDPM